MNILDCLGGRGPINPPVSKEKIAAALSQFPKAPVDLVAIWRQCDGFLLHDGLKLYSTDEIVERNETYQLEENARHFALIGDDSGGRAILLQSALPNSPVYICDMGFLDADYFALIGSNIFEWIQNGCPVDE